MQKTLQMQSALDTLRVMMSHQRSDIPQCHKQNSLQRTLGDLSRTLRSSRQKTTMITRNTLMKITLRGGKFIFLINKISQRSRQHSKPGFTRQQHVELDQFAHNDRFRQYHPPALWNCAIFLLQTSIRSICFTSTNQGFQT